MAGTNIYKWNTSRAFLSADKAGEEIKQVRVAAYCRVSTEDQDSSFQAQKKHFLDLLKLHEDWKIAGIYADEGISGTGMKKRTEFLRMLKDCEAGKIDMIVTKSISRFARNTVDMLITVRRLRDLGVRVLFEKEGLDKKDLADELFLTFWASFAQAESVSISRNVVAGLRSRMERGEGRVNSACSLGYNAVTGTKDLEIVPEDAVIIRRIFRMYLEGCSEKMIVERMLEDGIPAPKGGKRWYNTTVASILTNQKYMGDLLFQKTFTEDTLTHTIKVNDGQLPQYYITNHHAPIVPREIFYLVQGERVLRSSKRRTAGKKYHRSHPLAGRVFCGICGREMRMIAFPDGSIQWRCRRRASVRKTDWKENVPGCLNRHIDDCELRYFLTKAVYVLSKHREKLFELLTTCETEFAEMIDGLCLTDFAEESREAYQEKISLSSCRLKTVRAYLEQRLIKKLVNVVSGVDHASLDRGEECREPEKFLNLTDEMERITPQGDMMEDHWIRRLLDRVVIFPEYVNVIWRGGISVMLRFDSDEKRWEKTLAEPEACANQAGRLRALYYMLRSA